MAQKVARINWNCGQYSDVFRSAIIDPSPLKQGQKVTEIWGKTKKEYRAVVGCYPVEQGVQSGNQESELVSREGKSETKTGECLFLFCEGFKVNLLLQTVVVSYTSPFEGFSMQTPGLYV